MEKMIFIIIILIIAVIMAIILIQRLPYFKRKKIGSSGEEKTNDILRKFVKNNNCLLMTNVFLPLYDGTCEIDHILFGKFGVAVIETKNISGELYGDGKQLTHKIGNQQYTMYNPKFQNETHVKNIQHHLNKAGYKNTPIYSFVVFTSNDIKFPKSIGISISELEKSIKKLPDNKCIYKKLFFAIQNVKVINPLEKLKHNIKVSMK